MPANENHTLDILKVTNLIRDHHQIFACILPGDTGTMAVFVGPEDAEGRFPIEMNGDIAERWEQPLGDPSTLVVSCDKMYNEGKIASVPAVRVDTLDTITEEAVAELITNTFAQWTAANER